MTLIAYTIIYPYQRGTQLFHKPGILRALLQFRTGDATQQMVETALREGFI